MILRTLRTAIPSQKVALLRNSTGAGVAVGRGLDRGVRFLQPPSRVCVLARHLFPKAIAITFLVSADASPYIALRVNISQTNFPPARMQSGSLSNGIAPGHVTRWTARCVIGREGWSIENSFSPNAVNTYFFDGTNVLHTSKITAKANIPESIRKRLPLGVSEALDREPNESDWIFLAISPGDLPLNNFGVQLPWLAFCSGGYLSKPGRVVPLLSPLIRAAPGAFGFRDETEAFGDGLGLPREIQLFASERLFAKAVKHESIVRVGRTPSQIRELLNPQSGLPEGFLKARYHVLTHTNVGDWIIPTSFAYEEFAPGPGQKPTLVLAADGCVVSIQSAIRPILALSPGQRYSVADYRLRHRFKLVDQIHYAITNGEIPAANEPRLRRLFAKQAAAAPYDPALKAHLAIYSCFVVLVAGPIIFGAARWLWSKRKCSEVNINEK
jgi:hypothetical protein